MNYKVSFQKNARLRHKQAAAKRVAQWEGESGRHQMTGAWRGWMQRISSMRRHQHRTHAGSRFCACSGLWFKTSFTTADNGCDAMWLFCGAVHLAASALDNCICSAHFLPPSLPPPLSLCCFKCKSSCPHVAGWKELWFCCLKRAHLLDCSSYNNNNF